MKLNFTKYALITLLIFLLAGCTNIEDSISQEDAKQLVIEYHTNDNGSPSILSVELKKNSYYVEWVNTGNQEYGLDQVTKDGKIKIIEATIE